MKFAALLLSLSFASVAFADSPGSPLPASYAGVDYDYMSNFVTAAGCVSLGCGGEFYGTVQTTSTVHGVTVVANNAVTTNFWCVDSQESFNFGDQGYADIVTLSNIGSNPSQVRFSGVTDTSSPTWTDTALPSGYAVRYDMAAYLVSQYSGINSDPNNPTIVDDQATEAIQRALWVITNNSSVGVGDYEPTYNNLATSGGNAVGSVAYWIQQAQANYANFATLYGNNWAVVSWQSDASGSLTGQTNQQTFIAQILPPVIGTQKGPATPEPSFYVLLGLGMVGLLFAARRKNLA